MKRSSKSKNWMRAHVADPFVQRAQKEGYRSRAAYKLQQIAARDRLFAPGITVVDLGAAPGGWSQVAAAAVGRSGMVVALDVLEMAPVRGVTALCGDFRDPAALAALCGILAGRAVDLVLSDMAPNISGIAASDQARALELAEGALEFSAARLKPDGRFLVKVFQGAGFEGFLHRMRAQFRQVVSRKPEASRDRSSEIYLLGSGLKHPAVEKDTGTAG
ncbi:MAG TPA: RlmE family RNA methyltransferase [Burkholderiales bacterium]|nr:RlmE family RNA methyltransferase [Burkholderiales bacterium]